MQKVRAGSWYKYEAYGLDRYDSRTELKDGDLVQVVKPVPCCGRTTPMQGHIFKVTSIDVAIPGYRCNYCAVICPAEASAHGGEKPVDLSRLKRIPPLDELEGVRTEENIKEPA